MPGSTKSGNITSNETWGGEAFPGPIRMTADVTVNSGVIVRILPGTEFIAEGAFRLDVIGILYAGGQRRARVVFRSDAGGRGTWLGIRLSHILTAPSFLEYCDILDADIGLDYDLEQNNPAFCHQLTYVRFSNCKVGIKWDNRYMALNRCTFDGNHYGIAFLGGTVTNAESAPTGAQIWPRRGLFDCRFRRNDVGLNVNGTSSVTITDGRNRFYANCVAAATVELGGTLNAEGNWWGSDSGPSGAKGVTGGLGDAITGGGTVDVTPWAELGLYVRPDEVRDFCDVLLRETGTAAVPSLDLAMDDDDLEAIVVKAQGVVDSMLTDESLEKPYLARGTQTNEEFDAEEDRRPPVTYHTRYRPIRAVTTVQRRDGATWTTLANDETAGWWASERMLRDGLVSIAEAPTYRRSAFRTTYTHGFDDVPEAVKAATVKAAAIDVLHALIPPAAQDAYAARTASLREDLSAFEKRNRGSKVGWAL